MQSTAPTAEQNLHTYQKALRSRPDLERELRKDSGERQPLFHVAAPGLPAACVIARGSRMPRRCTDPDGRNA